MTKLETFREACAAAEDAPTAKYVAASQAMVEAYNDFKKEPDAIEQALTLVDDPNPMVRYMVAVVIRPAHRERADEMFKTIAAGSGTASLWASI
jgi:hypothetical protein